MEPFYNVYLQLFFKFYINFSVWENAAMLFCFIKLSFSMGTSRL